MDSDSVEHNGRPRGGEEGRRRERGWRGLEEGLEAAGSWEGRYDVIVPYLRFSSLLVSLCWVYWIDSDRAECRQLSAEQGVASSLRQRPYKYQLETHAR